MVTNKENLIWRGALSRWRSTLSGELLFVTATMSQPMVNIIGGFVAARFLQPIELGTINTAMLLPAYLAFLHLGVFTGVSRNLPIALGAGSFGKATDIQQSSSAVASFVGLASGFICGAITLVVWLHGSSALAWMLVATTVASATGPIANHVDVVMRARMEFGAAARIQLLTNGFMLFANVLVVTSGFIGAIWRVALGGLVGLALRLRSKIWRPTTSVDATSALVLARVGFPLMLSGTLFSLLMVADRSVVALMLGNEPVGQFSLAGMILNSLQVIPQSFAMILFPRMAHEYGRTNCPASLRRLVLLNLALNVIAVVPVCLLLYFNIDSLVIRFFPAYTAGVPAAKIACLTGIFWIYLGVGSVFGVLNQMRAYLLCMTLSIGSVWVFGALAIKSGYGIMGAAYARLGATALLCVFTIAYSLVKTKRRVAPSPRAL